MDNIYNIKNIHENDANNISEYGLLDVILNPSKYTDKKPVTIIYYMDG